MASKIFLQCYVSIKKKKKTTIENEISVSPRKVVQMISFTLSGICHSFSTFTLMSVKNARCYSFFFLQRL